jgi:hypothetical protein
VIGCFNGTSVDDDESTGRPTICTTPENVARIKELIRQDRRRTIRDIAEEVEVFYGTCQRVLTEGFGMQRVAVKFVPRILTYHQMQQRVDFCTEFRQLASDDETFLSRVITGDLAPCDFFLFPKMKLKLKGRRFDTIEEIQAETQEVLDTDRKGLPGSVPKMEETVGPVSTFGRELLRG